MLNCELAKSLKVGDTIYFVSLDDAYYNAHKVIKIKDIDIKIDDYCGSYLSYEDNGNRIYINENDAINHVLKELKINYFSLERKIKNLEHKLKNIG